MSLSGSAFCAAIIRSMYPSILFSSALFGYSESRSEAPLMVSYAKPSYQGNPRCVCVFFLPSPSYNQIKILESIPGGGQFFFPCNDVGRLRLMLSFEFVEHVEGRLGTPNFKFRTPKRILYPHI